MIKVPNTDELTEFDLRKFTLPPLEKYVDRSGYIYVLYDEAFPDYIKVGRTGDLHKRQIQYNADKPYKTAKMIYISNLFEDVNETERKILAYMYDNTSPTTLSREWFEIKHKDMILNIVEKAERLEEEQKNDNS